MNISQKALQIVGDQVLFWGGNVNYKKPLCVVLGVVINTEIRFLEVVV